MPHAFVFCRRIIWRKLASVSSRPADNATPSIFASSDCGCRVPSQIDGRKRRHFAGIVADVRRVIGAQPAI